MDNRTKHRKMIIALIDYIEYLDYLTQEVEPYEKLLVECTIQSARKMLDDIRHLYKL